MQVTSCCHLFLYAPDSRLDVFIWWQQHTPCCYLCGESCNSSLITWQTHFPVIKYYQIQMRLHLQPLLVDCGVCVAPSETMGVCCLSWRTLSWSYFPDFFTPSNWQVSCHTFMVALQPLLHCPLSQLGYRALLAWMHSFCIHPTPFPTFCKVAFLSDFLVIPQSRFGMWCSASHIHFAITSVHQGS